MELLQQLRQSLQPRLAGYSRKVLDLVPDGATGRKLGLIFTILEGIGRFAQIYWGWQKMAKGTDIDTQRLSKLMRERR